ncbi:acid protease [Clathrospora elynae]|uniref:Acid protease n=1 Tax=Clathrospora elynae TaxID=706981 RepID=A0A6A5S3M3_9PLEO|nr:acid protease [Clathrospora elynae]
MSSISTSKAPEPAPISYAASQYFDGNDGKWSSFVVRAGTPEQSFRVLPSTVTTEIFLPMEGACKENATISKVSPGALTTHAMLTVLSQDECVFSRGAEVYQGKPNNGFQAKKSSTWHQIGIYQVAAREELGYNASGLYGLDTLGLMIANSGGPTLQNQTIGGVVNDRLWVGRLGMDVKPSNFSDFEDPQRSLITTLKEEGYIPSRSYGYTAGAYYKKPNAFGSLTYGGYDQSRFVPNNVTFSFDANDSRKPSLNIQSIVTQDMSGNTVSLLPDGAAYTLVDFAESQIWLPATACDEFARAFNLTHDNSTDLYLIDSYTHARLVETNPSITFGLGQTSDPGQRVNIVLPYSAFDQQASYPIYENATNYFPIKRAYNDTQYTLGRTFFQEAYITIDYERGNFSVHQALFPTTNDKQQIIPILAPESGNASEFNGASSMRLGKKATAAISIGSVAFLMLLVMIVFWTHWRRVKAKEKRKPVVEELIVECADQPKVETDGVAFYEKDGLPFAEMEGHVFPELHCPGTELEAGELDVRITRSDLSTIFELYELGDEERFSYEEPEAVMPEKRWPPPGWI